MFARLPAPNIQSRSASRRVLGALFVLALAAAGCTPLQPGDTTESLPPDSTPAPVATESTPAESAPVQGVGEPDVTTVVSATALLTAPVALTATVVATEAPDAAIEPAVSAETAATTLEAGAVLSATLPISGSAALTAAAALSNSVPLTLAFANAPVALSFPDLALTVPVQPMGWELVRTETGRSTEWLLPTEAAGWHPGSAGAGEAGNMIISGSQLLGAAVFAPLALGEVSVGQEILVTSVTGEEHAYTVVELSEPLALTGDADAAAALADYLQAAPAATSRLTLLTGWPDFTTTHRLVVVAERPAEAP